jgi:translation initiation factor IF-2
MLKTKPPIVVVLGHVDHGKTTLLDYIRKTKIAEKEAGGITQKIGASEVEFEGKHITFIDTPGHEAFSKLRERGAKIADIGVLVIAADDGIMPQTIESLEYLKAYKIPFIVAINKIDKKNVDPERVIFELANLGYLVESIGGDIPCVKISAKTGEGVDDLLTMISLISETRDIKYDPDVPGEGFILEVFKDAKRGFLASVILNNGHLKLGDYLITASSFSKVKILEDQFGHQLKIVYPSTPILVGPFSGNPLAGQNCEVGSEDEIEKIKEKLEEREAGFYKKILVSEEAEGDFNFIIKGDHLGSLEAIENLLKNLGEKYKKKIKIVKADLGEPTDKDILLAKQTGSVLIFFNVKIPHKIQKDLKDFNLGWVSHNIIYHLMEDCEKILKGEDIRKEIKGRLEVLATFSQTASKKTIGGKVLEGSFSLNQKVKIIRNGFVVGQGKILSLKKEKLSVDKVNEGELCGMMIETKSEILVGDFIER